MAAGLRGAKRRQARRALFEAAIALFREQGFDATTVDEIAQRAGYSRATFFNHFKTKDGVLRFYGEHLREQVEAELLLLGPETSPLERVRTMLNTMLVETERHRGAARIVHMYSIGDRSYLATPTPARMRILELLTALMREAQEAGQIRPDLPMEETSLLVAGVLQMAALSLVMGDKSAESMAHVTWRLILGGVRGEGETAQ